MEDVKSGKENYKIAFVVASLGISGGTNIILNHAYFLKKRGYDVEIISDDYNQKNNWHEGLSLIPTRSFESITNVKYDVCFFTHWTTVYKQNFVKSNKYMYFIQSIESLFNNDINEIIFAQNTYSYGFPYITVANWIHEYLQREYSATGKVVLNGLDKSIFKNRSFEEIEKNRGCSFKVLVEGQLNRPTKNTNYAVKLAQKSEAEEVFLLTNTPVNEFKKCSKVYSNIPINKVSSVYDQCDVLLKLSHVEGMYGPPLEAFASGCTVITNKVTGHEEYIKDGYNALVVNEDKEAVEKINYLVKNKDVLLQLKKNALKTYQEWPSLEDSGESFEKSMLELIDNYSINQKSHITMNFAKFNSYIKQREEFIKKESSLLSKLKYCFNKREYKRKYEIKLLNIAKKALNIPSIMN